MCVPLAIAAAAVSAAGALTSGYAGMQQGNFEAAVARQNAQLAENQASDSIARGRTEARDLYRQVGQAKGEQIAAMAANGIDVNSGSALTTQQDTASLANDDAANLYKNISERTKGFEINAANYRSEAAAKKAAGRSAFVGSLFQAGSSLMGGFSQQSALSSRMGLSGGTKVPFGKGY